MRIPLCVATLAAVGLAAAPADAGMINPGSPTAQTINRTPFALNVVNNGPGAISLWGVTFQPLGSPNVNGGFLQSPGFQQLLSLLNSGSSMVRVAPIQLGQGAKRVKWWIVFLLEPPANGSNPLVSVTPPTGNTSPGGGSGVNPPVNLNPPATGPTTIEPNPGPVVTNPTGSLGSGGSPPAHMPEPPGIILGALAGLTALACAWRQRRQTPPLALA
jgi:hypothetical protein